MVPSEEDGSEQIVSDGNVVIHIPTGEECAGEQTYMNIHTTTDGSGSHNYVTLTQGEAGQQYVEETCITTDGQTIIQS